MATSAVAPRSAQVPDGAFAIAAFVEKPDAARAEEFLKSGKYLWNSGMFLFRASRFLEELDKHAPDIARNLPPGVRSRAP